jgi:hypothetical protein
MAKRTIRKTDPEHTMAPEQRRTAARNGSPAPRARTRSRKTATETGGVTASGVADIPDMTEDAVENGATSIEVPHDHIAVRAYHLYLERGGRGGDEFQDWVTAERELRKRSVGGRLR